MKKTYLLICVIFLICSLSALDFVPREMIIKLKKTSQFSKGKFKNKEFQSFLQAKSLTNLKSLSPKKDNLFLVARFNNDLDWNSINAANKKYDGIEYIQPNYLNSLYITPNDTQISQQQLEMINLPQAWDINRGTRQIIVGVIDSGLMFNHPDLQTNVYYNPNEISGNGIDDDNNGYIDDWRGWDFADAPNMSDIALGDFLTPDNDPTDDNKHGTHVSGIIGADTNNNQGIAGVCWNISILAVRAGFRTLQGAGYLEDDDAAAAIIYATDMGADVLNLSWGDNNYSPIIADACQYAYDKGVIIVAAAGNEPSPEVSFPARLATTISVGAVDEARVLSIYSSYGPDLDIVAPGNNILSCYDTTGTNTYFKLSGTSMAAPFVTASIALLLSNTPGLSLGEVKSKLFSSTIDLGTPGFDNMYGNGLLNTQRLLESNIDYVLEITNPWDFAGYSDDFDIVGTVKVPNLNFYTVMYTDKSNPTIIDWYNVNDGHNSEFKYYEQVENGVLAHFIVNANLPDNVYKIRVQVVTRDNRKYQIFKNIYIDHTPPELDPGFPLVSFRYNGPEKQYNIKTSFDEIVKLTLSVFNNEGFTQEFCSIAQDTMHTIILPNTIPEGTYSYSFTATNLAGLILNSSVYYDILDISYETVPSNLFIPSVLGNGWIPIGKLVDYDNNNFKEIIALNIVDNQNDLVKFYEFQGDSIVVKHTMSKDDKFWPLDVSKPFNGQSGNIEYFILGLKVAVLGLYHYYGVNQVVENAYVIAPEDDKNSVYGAAFVDYNADDNEEIAYIQDYPTERLINLAKIENRKIVNEKRLYNTSTTFQRNSFVSKVLCDNFNTAFDNDNIPDIITADTDGDIMIFNVKNVADSTKYLQWSYRMPVKNTYYLTKGDYDGDGTLEFVVGGYEKNNNPETTYWQFTMFKADALKSYAPVSSIQFSAVTTSQNSVASSDLNHDGKDELVLALAPNMYICSLVDSTITPTYVTTSQKTYQVFATDDDGNSNSMLIINKGISNQLRATILSPNTIYDTPPTPANFHGYPLNENKVKLFWSTTNAEYYKIYRQDSLGSWNNLGFTEETSYIDSNLVNMTSYRYYVTAVNNTFPVQESYTTPIIALTTGAVPQFVSLTNSGNKNLKLLFNKPLHPDINENSNFRLSNGEYPTSVNLVSNNYGVLLTLPHILQDVYPLRLNFQNLRAFNGTPIPDSNYAVSFENDIQAPRLDSIRVIDRKNVELIFSEQVEENAVLNMGNYFLENPGLDMNNSIDSLFYLSDKVKVTFRENLKYSNQPYYLTVRNIKDLSGNLIPNNFNKLRFSLTEITDLNYMEVYPNPLYLNEFREMKFINLPLNKSGEIWIYNLNGELIFNKAIPALNSSTNYFSWSGVNNKSKRISSGIYFYVLKMGNDVKKGKLAVFSSQIK